MTPRRHAGRNRGDLAFNIRRRRLGALAHCEGVHAQDVRDRASGAVVLVAFIESQFVELVDLAKLTRLNRAVHLL